MKLEDKIILLRKQKGWSQEELAAQMDVSRQSVSKWESGASIPDIDKILLLSQIFGTTTDFLLKDDVEISENMEDEGEKEIKREEPKRRVTRQEAMEFFETRKKVAPKIALGVWLCIVSPVLMMVLLGLTKYDQFGVTENIAVIIGLGFLFVLVTIAVSLFIMNGMILNKYEYIEKQVILIDAELAVELRNDSDNFMPTFIKNIVLGVVLCIMSVIPLVTFSIMENEVMILGCVGLLLFVVACGVYRFVKVGIIKVGYDQILQREDYTAGKKETKKQMEPIASIYWMSVTILYLVISFFTNRWGITWLIWAVAGIIFGIITVIVQSTGEKK